MKYWQDDHITENADGTFTCWDEAGQYHIKCATIERGREILSDYSKYLNKQKIILDNKS